jgi:tetratricopeptide (TPR) repeat protein
MMARLTIAFIVVSFGLGGSGFAQWVSDPGFDAHVQRGIDHTYNLEFEKAEADFTELVRMRPDHPAGYFFLAMVDWWRILLDLDDDSRDSEFFNKLEKVIEMCNGRLDKDENDITALFFKGGAIGFRGRLHANRNHWLRAANDGRRALGIVKKAHELQPNNADILLGTGIYNYYADVIPQRYGFLKPLMWFLPKGDKEKGIGELRRASREAKYARVESTYFLMQLYFFFEKQYGTALELARELHRLYPNNSLFHRYVGRCMIALNRLDEANAMFTEVLKRHEESRAGYNKSSAREALYYLGMHRISVGHPEEALNYLERSDRLSRELDRDSPSGYMVMTSLRMGMAYDLLKRRDYAIQSYKKVLAMSEYEDSHKLAKQYIEKPYGAN